LEEHITSILRVEAKHAGVFLGLLLNPEDGGDMFLQKVG
jgi:hypothetical protein